MIADVADGVFVHYSEHNKSQRHYITNMCFLSQIVEDVQNFYATTYNENNNGTLIISYQKIVSRRKISIYHYGILNSE